MARNQEKANSMLNRFVQAKKDALKAPVEKRPFIATEVNDIGQCERWRSQVIKEISKKVSEIQNAALGEHKIRDLNDHINKLLREKKHWERQIKQLGGADYLSANTRVVDGDGKYAMGTDGYFYFGAAKELPGVRELFEKYVPAETRRTRYDLYQKIDAQYYGFRDDDDGLLVKLEAVQEKKAIDSEINAWRELQRQNKVLRRKAKAQQKNGQNANQKDQPQDDDSDQDEHHNDNTNDTHNNHTKQQEPHTHADVFKAHVELPDQSAIEAAILAKRKRELLAKYQTST